MAVFSPKSEYLIHLICMLEAWTLAPGARDHTAQPEWPSHPPWEGEEILSWRQQSVWESGPPPCWGRAEEGEGTGDPTVASPPGRHI